MFGASTQQQQQQLQSQLQPPTATKETTTPAEEESLKRNTDCVYFLASPLTCKKRSECEYRHSDIARVNPRDCWYWLNGNCLNPKCAFRHPPLDGLLGIQLPTPTPVGPSLPPPQAASTPVGPTNVSGKQGAPCIFFQKGFCLKGDRCHFFHSPPFAPNKVPQLAVATPVTDSPYTNKSFGGLEKTTSKEQKVPQTNIPKPVERQPQVKPAARVETALSKNGVATDKYVPPSSAVDDELHRYRPTNVPQATQGDSINRSTCVVQPHVLDDNGNKDVDEFSRGPSPGFDVLVDDELRDSDYYPNEDQFGNLNPLNDYDVGRSADNNSMVDVDWDLYRDPNGYDSYERVRGQQYGWEEDIASTERKLGRQESKRYPRVGSPDQIDESDLRYRLAKQRRGNNGLRSVISRDHAHDNSDGDRSYQAPRRDGHRVTPLESSVSSRLWGRIKIPGRSASPDSRELERGRNRGRFSPGGPLITSYHGRLRDRINGRVEEDFNNLRGSRIRRDVINDDNKAKFIGPKRLAELKVVKNGESDRPSVGKRKFPKVEDHHQQSEGDVSFEGPKPLSEILKRKRGSESNEDGNQKQRKEKLKDAANQVQSVKENNKSASSVSDTENMKRMEGGQSTLKRNVSEGESEEGMIGEEAMGAYDRREGGAEEEPVDEEDYNVEGAEKEEEYLDDDEDDFAKKIGVMYS